MQLHWMPRLIKYLESSNTAQFSFLHWQKSFAKYHHHTTACQHGFFQRIKQANYQHEYHTK